MKYIIHTEIKPSQIYTKEDAASLASFLAKHNVHIKDFRPPEMGESYISCTTDGYFTSKVYQIGCVEIDFFGKNSNQPRFIVEQTQTVWE